MVGRIQAHGVSESEVMQKQAAAIMERGGIDGGRWTCKVDRDIPPSKSANHRSCQLHLRAPHRACLVSSRQEYI